MLQLILIGLVVVVTLKITKATQPLDLGFCPNLGHCKVPPRPPSHGLFQATKRNGSPCGAFVNLQSGSNCAFHIVSTAKHLSAIGGPFNATSSQPPKAWQRATLGDCSNLAYAGRIVQESR